MNTEKNNLIAEFLHGKENSTVHPNQYHENWNELMAVVQKCKERQFFGSQRLITNIDKRLIECDLGAVYSNVVDFIESYNKNS